MDLGSNKSTKWICPVTGIWVKDMSSNIMDLCRLGSKALRSSMWEIKREGLVARRFAKTVFPIPASPTMTVDLKGSGHSYQLRSSLTFPWISSSGSIVVSVE